MVSRGEKSRGGARGGGGVAGGAGGRETFPHRLIFFDQMLVPPNGYFIRRGEERWRDRRIPSFAIYYIV